MDGCLFCRIASGEIPAKRRYEDALCVAIDDIAPQAPVHVLFLPRRHLPGVAAAGEDDAALLGHLAFRAARLAHALGLGSGYRLVVNEGTDAGQTVAHLHLHLLGGAPLGPLG